MNRTINKAIDPARLSCGCQWKGVRREVFISCDGVLWIWIPGHGQESLCASFMARELLDEHGIPGPALDKMMQQVEANESKSIYRKKETISGLGRWKHERIAIDQTDPVCGD
jgi:hypothetical protein